MTFHAWHEEPIAKSQDRAAFDYGDGQMNDFLVRFARQSHEQNASKTLLSTTQCRTAFWGSIDRASAVEQAPVSHTRSYPP
ncbi:hypothetical protein [Rhizobium cauense]|uniref:hypothetical protein n=1 Tax=Rhizobium cauense TaxID=1166683 RepID=UPI001CB78842|nr:hypothetical protein [Rhizobium cauense]